MAFCRKSILACFSVTLDESCMSQVRAQIVFFFFNDVCTMTTDKKSSPFRRV